VLGGEEREMTIMFSDMRGFTSISETYKNDPQGLTALMNRFLTPLTNAILSRKGTIDKYMGDAIMAFWNAPLDIADHPRKACLAALEMLAGLERLNRERGSDLKIGIGLNSGATAVGNLGSAQRFSYSAIGDSVNLASRVEGLTKNYGVAVLVTEATRARAPDLAFLEVDLVRVVGRAEPVPVHTLLGDADYARTPGFKKLAEAHARFISAYRSGDLHTTDAQLAEVRSLADVQLDKLYELYAGRLGEMRVSPPPPGWDGVFTASQK
jgi:adenylate cyclase